MVAVNVDPFDTIVMVEPLVAKNPSTSTEKNVGNVQLSSVVPGYLCSVRVSGTAPEKVTDIDRLSDPEAHDPAITSLKLSVLFSLNTTILSFVVSKNGANVPLAGVSALRSATRLVGVVGMTSDRPVNTNSDFLRVMAYSMASRRSPCSISVASAADILSSCS